MGEIKHKKDGKDDQIKKYTNCSMLTHLTKQWKQNITVVGSLQTNSRGKTKLAEKKRRNQNINGEKLCCRT